MTIRYTQSLIAETTHAYEQACLFLGGLAERRKLIDGRMHYYFNKQKTQVIRTSPGEKTIELSDKVDGNVKELIQHILNTEKREDDVSFSSIFKN